MLWEITWGKQIKTLLEFQQASGQKPKALRDRPALKDSLRHLLEAFYDLSAGRSVGEVPQPIQTADILAYCQLFEISSELERTRIFKTVRQLDGAYLKHHIDKTASS